MAYQPWPRHMSPANLTAWDAALLEKEGAVALCNRDLSWMFSFQFIKIHFGKGDRKSSSHPSVEEEKGVAIVSPHD
eukprot:746928-Ditylum_brightwellii.AAC.1